MNLTIEEQLEVLIEEILGVEALMSMIMNFYGENIQKYEDFVVVLDGENYTRHRPKKLDLDLKNRETPLGKQSINTIPVIIATYLNEGKVQALIPILRH